jgi:hypothetical protein
MNRGAVFLTLAIGVGAFSTAGMAAPQSRKVNIQLEGSGSCEIVLVEEDPVLVGKGDTVHWLFENNCKLTVVAIVPQKMRGPKYKKNPHFPGAGEEDPFDCGDPQLTIPADGVIHDLPCKVKTAVNPRVYKYAIVEEKNLFPALDPEVEVRDPPPPPPVQPQGKAPVTHAAGTGKAKKLPPKKP